MNHTTLLEALPFVLETIELPCKQQSGKVREMCLQNGQRIIVTTDRVSAFDVILGSIPMKGQVLTQLSTWWFGQTKDIIPHHLLSNPDPNVMVVKNAQPLPVEVIVRGYITGVTKTSLWKLYEAGERNAYGISLPDGLPESLWNQIERTALALFKRGQELARKAGLLLVDTKYEFGLVGDQLTLIDEIHTPDSSRYWTLPSYEQNPDKPESLDKEFLREWFASKGYRGEGKIPTMPDEFRVQVAERYIRVYETLTGQTFIPGATPIDTRILGVLRAAAKSGGQEFE
jgi:phosphoribosylaminoimidazole-succinocarboxamide synthase